MFDTLLRGLPYICVFLLLYIIYLFDKRDKFHTNHKKYVAWANIILLLFIGLRGFVMTDFISYYPFFDLIQDIDSLPTVILLKGWEPGFIIYTYICKLIFPNYFVWIFVSTAIDLWLLNIVVQRYSVNHIMSLMCFFAVGGLPLEMNVLRNAKAVLIFLLSIKYIQDKKLLKYVGVILLAMTFHMSAILYLPLYFILNRKWPDWILWAIFVVGIVVLFFHFEILSFFFSNFTFEDEDSRLGHYASHHVGDMDAYRISFGTIERIFTYIFLVIFYKRIKEKDEHQRIFINMYFFVFISFFYLSESPIAVQRIQYLFIPCFWFFYPFVINKMAEEKNVLFRSVFGILIFTKLLMIGTIPENKYENLLFGISKYEDRVTFTEKSME